VLAGKWTYRSYRNDPALVGDESARALAMILGEGVLDFDEEKDGRFTGGLGMRPGYALALTGTVEGDGFAITGLGLDGTATAGWRYDYRGVPGPLWPDAVDQVPCLLGTLIRVNAHGPDSPAGYTASFISIRQRIQDREVFPRVRALMAGQ